MGRPSKKARVVRESEEFNLRRLLAQLSPPLTPSAAYAWTLEQIRAARDEQMRGVFKLPARLAESMRTDDALFVGYRNRLAPQRVITVDVEPANESAKAKSIAVEATALFGERGIGITQQTLESINGTLANHAVAFGVVQAIARDDGSRVDLFLKHWPIEWVRWDPIATSFVTQIDPMTPDSEPRVTAGLVPITHGDGRWVVFAKHEESPWKQDACVLPGALVWAAHGLAARDWSKGSTAHGNAKVVGEMPEGVALQDAAGQLTKEAQAFLELLQAMASVDAPVGIRPAGSKTEYIVNNSTAWQVWQELMNNREKAAARIYLGTDGILGSQGGAPGVDISQLFGVATTIVQGDLSCLERGIFEGVIQPWTAINFGDSTLAPRRRYLMPDADADRERESFTKRLEAFHAEIKRRKDNGFLIDEATVTMLAQKYDVPTPVLAPAADRNVPIDLAPTDVAKVVTAKEARASRNLPPFGDKRDDKTIPELEAAGIAEGEAAAPQPAPQPAPNGAPKQSTPAAPPS